MADADLYVELPTEDEESERYLTEAFKGGLPLKVVYSGSFAPPGYQSPEWMGAGIGGGPGGITIDLLIEHSSAVLDGLVAIGAWEVLRRGFKKLGERFYRVWFRIAPKQHRLLADGSNQSPFPIVTYEISLSLEAGGFDEKAFDGILDDYRRLVRHCEALRKSANSKQWSTAQIELIRSLIARDEPSP